jgi:hypothetical protein
MKRVYSGQSACFSSACLAVEDERAGSVGPAQTCVHKLRRSRTSSRPQRICARARRTFSAKSVVVISRMPRSSMRASTLATRRTWSLEAPSRATCRRGAAAAPFGAEKGQLREACEEPVPHDTLGCRIFSPERVRSGRGEMSTAGHRMTCRRLERPSLPASSRRSGRRLEPACKRDLSRGAMKRTCTHLCRRSFAGPNRSGDAKRRRQPRQDVAVRRGGPQIDGHAGGSDALTLAQTRQRAEHLGSSTPAWTWWNQKGGT